MDFKVKITNETFIDDAGNSMPYVAYVLTIDNEEFRLVPKKRDKRLISYLINKHKALPKEDSVLEVDCKITQEQFRDTIKRRTVDFVAYTISLFGREFRFVVREDDRNLIKYLLEERGFFITDDDEKDDEDDE